jgi:predicted DNA binding protein
MKLLPCSWRNTDMIIRTFYNHNSLVNRVIYELPRHQEVNEFTKMTLVEKRGNWYVIADVYPTVKENNLKTLESKFLGHP